MYVRESDKRTLVTRLDGAEEVKIRTRIAKAV